MRSKNNLPVFGISDIRVPLKAGVFSLSADAVMVTPPAHAHNKGQREIEKLLSGAGAK
jgi:hypothetical protein